MPSKKTTKCPIEAKFQTTEWAEMRFLNPKGCDIVALFNEVDSAVQTLMGLVDQIDDKLDVPAYGGRQDFRDQLIGAGLSEFAADQIATVLDWRSGEVGVFDTDWCSDNDIIFDDPTDHID